MLSLIMVFSVVGAALADVTITIERDDSYNAEASGNRDYTAYQIFRADYTSHEATGGGVTSGTPGSITDTPSTGVSYYLDTTDDAARITQLAAAGNVWFDLTPTADGTKQIITWKSAAATTAANVQAAAAWLANSSNYTPIQTYTLDFNSTTNKWSKSVAAGYYVVSGSEGKNLIAATTDINIKEKNSYPTVDKQQKKANGTWQDAALPIEIGQTINYVVTVPVPADANKALAIVDKMTAGLTYDNNLSVKLDAEDGTAVTSYTAMTSEDAEYDSATNVAFQIKFSDATVKDNLAGHTLYLLYSAKVNENAITDTGRENEVTIKYDDTHYSVTDHVDYELYTGGAVKYDGATADVNSNNALTQKGTADIAYLQGAEFKLQVKNGNNWVDLPVVAGTGFYRPAVAGETGVALVSDANGAIIIRGLDKNKQYQLVETKAPDGGYNLASTTAVLDVTTKDDKTNVGLKGSDTDTTYLDNATTELSSKIANNKGSVLPSTGGIGTTIFYVIGAVLVLGAAAIIIARRKAEQ